MRKMFAYIVAFGAIALNGCASTNVGETLEDELAREFGSYEIACEARMTIIPAFAMKGLPVELSRDDRMEVLKVLRKCTRYGEKATGAKVVPSHGFRCSPSLAMELRLESKEKKFSIFSLATGYLGDYLCPAPDLALEVCGVVRLCALECEKAYEKSISGQPQE